MHVLAYALSCTQHSVGVTLGTLAEGMSAPCLSQVLFQGSTDSRVEYTASNLSYAKKGSQHRLFLREYFILYDLSQFRHTFIIIYVNSI